MKAWIPLTLMFALASAAHAQSTCTYPKAPDAPPDGATATKEQMVTASTDFKRYNGEMNSYLECLKLSMDAAPKDTSKLSADDKKKLADEQKILVQKNNAAVDELQANVGRFNEQLKIYKAKPKS
jgi:dynactin complex subunit